MDGGNWGENYPASIRMALWLAFELDQLVFLHRRALHIPPSVARKQPAACGRPSRGDRSSHGRDQTAFIPHGCMSATVCLRLPSPRFPPHHFPTPNPQHTVWAEVFHSCRKDGERFLCFKRPNDPPPGGEGGSREKLTLYLASCIMPDRRRLLRNGGDLSATVAICRSWYIRTTSYYFRIP